MSFYKELINNIITEAEKTNPYASIVYGSDPPLNGICFRESGGAPTQTNLDKGMIISLPAVLNGKHTDQELLIDDLTAIHEALTRRTDYSDLSTNDVQLIDIESVSLPAIIGREQNNQWICGSSLEIHFYWSK